MTKRADAKFERNRHDFYPTPLAAIEPLLPHLPPRTRFYEPCCGNGVLAKHLVEVGHICMGMSDIDPSVDGARIKDALSLGSAFDSDCFITNPPWHRPLMHNLIVKLAELAPTWLLLDSDWLFTKQATPYLSNAWTIVAIGRVRWIPDTSMDGYDNACWVEFRTDPRKGGTRFVARQM